MNSKNNDSKIDMSLYDRQVRTYGEEASKRINSSNVVVYGLGGLGTEICKNLALGGVKNLYLYDRDLPSDRDIETGIYYQSKDYDKPKSSILITYLKELNPYTTLYDVDTITPDILENSTLVVVNQTFDKAIELNKMVRELNSKMVYVCSSGLTGFVFVDAGDSHSVLDTIGENIEPVQIGNVTDTGIVSCAIHCEHDFQTGDLITFTNLEGETLGYFEREFKIRVINKTTFQLEDFRPTSGRSDGKLFKFVNGTAIHIKQETIFKHKSLEEQLVEKSLVGFDWDSDGKIIDTYRELIKSDYLHPWSDEMEERLSHYEDSLHHMVRSYGTELIPVVSFMGSFASAEVIKLVSHKFTPISQWWVWKDYGLIDGMEKPELIHSESSMGKLLGKDFIDKLETSNVLMVGCGALGCEWLKLLAKLNIGTKGIVDVVDPDHIERSNLNRQFLFRSEHIGKSKSEVAIESIKSMNSSLNLKAYTEYVSSSNQEFTDMLFKEKTLVINALDNIKARKYVDEQCFRYQLPLFESGTQGMKGNTQPVIPFLTETYSNSNDAPQEKSFPVCTIKNFPNQILHTIHWARDNFEFFNRAPENVNSFRKNPLFHEELASYESEVARQDIKLFLVDKNPSSWKECATWAVELWLDNYVYQILQLLHNFPKDHMKDDGRPFWSEGKRCPTPMEYDLSNPLILDYIEATTHLLARCCSLEDNFTRENLVESLVDYVPKDFEVKTDLKIASNDEELKDMEDDLEETVLHEGLEVSKEYVPQEFEKDDDTNWHISWITSASNCRATNYNIPVASEQDTKGIAGRIIPAVATTTSAVVGLIGMELLKYVRGVDDIDMYQSWFVNMADNTNINANPFQAPMVKIGEKEFNSWTKINCSLDTSLEKFIEQYEEMFNCNINMILYKSSILYAPFLPCDKTKSLSVIFKEKYDIDIYETSVPVLLSCSEDYDIPSIELKLSKLKKDVVLS